MDYRVLLYYKFEHVPSPEAERAAQEALCRELGLLGRILIAPEGINGTVSGPKEATDAYQAHMQAHAQFAGIEFKEDPHAGHAFHKLHVRVKPELVHLSADQDYDPKEETAPYIEPEEMLQVLREEPEDVVILDTRSDYEFVVGKFKNAITLPIGNFRELPEHLHSIEHLKDKTIITYCTGGIRCEKVTGLMMRKGFKKVKQLHGGIIRYAHETGGEHFEGLCYVFDGRVAVPVNEVNPKVIGTCHNCGAPTERSVNCANADCNEQVLLCDDCLEIHKGCCSAKCADSPRVREFDGTGVYYRGINSKTYVKA